MMTNKSEHANEKSSPSRVSKRETVAAFYTRMTGGLRRRSPQREDATPPAPDVATDTDVPATASAQDGAESETENASTVGPRSEMEWNDLISHRIEEAIRNGAFDNLRNKGKPLPQEYNPHVPEDRRMANDLLKNNGLAPQWISDRASMLHVIDNFRTKLRTVAMGYHTAWHAESTDVIKRQQIRAQWATQLETWQEEIRLLNRRIEVVNLQQPIARLEIFKLLLDEELKRVGMTRELG
ncbi:MAG: DUF1992 domain-containing protein [Caldilineaceae bacterium]|nr:DUF1992 domain-containing protein [Caldilineaceae bacterium]